MRGVIYKYTNIHNGKVYIGQTVNEPKRREKWRNLKTPYAGNYINRARMKYGLESFEYEILVEVTNEDEDILRETLNSLEEKYITLYQSKNPNFGYNLTDGGESGNGQIVSKETRDKIGKAHKGLKKKMSEQGKRNISLAHKSARPWAWKKVAQYDKDTGELIKIWNSLSEVTSYFGDKSNSNLIYAIQGKYRHKYYRGYKWKYYGVDS